MAADPTKTELNPVKRFFSGTDTLIQTLQAVSLLGTLLAAIASTWLTNRLFLVIALILLALVAAWVVISWYLRRRRPKPPVLPNERPRSGSYLRGFLPFEKGDRLLGRDLDIGQLLAMVRSLEFRFGYLSGEAGTGKTSLLRAGLLAALEAEENSRWYPVYVMRTGGTPVAAIRKELLADLKFDEPPPQDVSLVDLMEKTRTLKPGKTIFVVIDQFEEFFLLNPTAAEREHFETELRRVSESMADGLPVRILFALRKEFVDDLLDFGRVSPEFGDGKRRHPLRNFPRDVAHAVLRDVARSENLGFSDELQELVIGDLVRDERVRPVEFQLVLTRLLEQAVYTAENYRSHGGARGIMTRFVAELIDPPDIQVSEIDRQVTRQALRALCNETFTARRPVGLPRRDLADRVTAQLVSGANLPASRAEVEAALDRVIGRLRGAYVLIDEDEQRLNLAHDYLSLSIRDATADIETAEEQANRLLEQYVQQARTDAALVVPLHSYRSIRRYATPERRARTEAAALLRHSFRRYYEIAGGAVVAGLLIITRILPEGIGYHVRDPLSLGATATPVISTKGNLLVFIDHGAGDWAIQVRLDRSPFEKEKLLPNVGDIVLSPTGDNILAFGQDGSLYQIRVGSDAKPEKLLDNLGWIPPPGQTKPPGGWAGFSQDGSWAFANTAEGITYAWPVTGRPQRVFHSSTLADALGNAISIGGTEESRRPHGDPVPPHVGFANKGSHLWIVDGKTDLFVFDPTHAPGDNVAPIATLGGSADLVSVKASSDGKWLAATTFTNTRAPGVILVKLDDAQVLTSKVAIQETKTYDDQRPALLSFSPDSQPKWLVSRYQRDNFYAISLAEPIKAQTFPAVDLGAEFDNDRMIPVVFSRDGKFAAGTEPDGNMYVWDLANAPGATATPAIETAGAKEPFRQRWSTAAFCQNNRSVLISTGEGTVKAAGLADASLHGKIVGLPPKGTIRFAFGGDGDTVLAFNDAGLFAGSCGDPLKPVWDASDSQRVVDDGSGHLSDIQRVVDDTHGHLIVIGTRNLARVDRAFYVWGLPVWRPWPPIESEED
jgi:hypothetical protein